VLNSRGQGIPVLEERLHKPIGGPGVCRSRTSRLSFQRKKGDEERGNFYGCSRPEKTGEDSQTPKKKPRPGRGHTRESARGERRRE